MGNSLRCCLACVLPCGALDLIRIVHINGQVDQYSQPVSAAEVMASNPNHVLTKPCSDSTATVRRITLVSPNSELKRGHIYFLVPASSFPEKRKKKNVGLGQKRTSVAPVGVGECHRRLSYLIEQNEREEETNAKYMSITNRSMGLPAKSMQRRQRGTGRFGAWRQQLESISEDL